LSRLSSAGRVRARLSLKTGKAVDGTHATFSGRGRGQAPKPRSGRSKTPGLRPVQARGMITMAAGAPSRMVRLSMPAHRASAACCAMHLESSRSGRTAQKTASVGRGVASNPMSDNCPDIRLVLPRTGRSGDGSVPSIKCIYQLAVAMSAVSLRYEPKTYQTSSCLI
jgi:hypothetical protein